MQLSTRSALLAKKVEFLKEVQLFASLREDNLRSIANDFQVRVFQANEVILRQDDPYYELYVVVKGKIRIYKVGPAGEETSVNILSPRQIIGEFSIIDGQARSATAKAITRCALLGMPRDKFLAHLKQIQDLAFEMCRLVVSKARWATEYAEAIAQHDTADRLRYMLLYYNEQMGEEIELGKQYRLNLGLNQTDLASLVGARRGWVNHILTEWRNRGLIDYEAGNITILDLPRIQQEYEFSVQNNALEW